MILQILIPYTFCLLPILFLAFTPTFKILRWDDKIIVAGLAVILTSNFFGIHIRTQSSIAFSIISVLYAIYNHYFCIKQKWWWIIVVYAIWNFISFSWSVDKVVGLHSLRTYSLFLLFPLIFACIRLSVSSLRTISIVFFRTSFLFIVISLILWLYESNALNINLTDWIKIQKAPIAGQNAYDIIFNWSKYTHPTFVIIPLILANAIGLTMCNKHIGSDKIHYIESACYSMLCLLLIVITQGRIGLINWIIITMSILLVKTFRNKFIFATLASLFIILLTFVAFTKKDDVLKFFSDPIRSQLLYTAVYSIKNRPMFGVGLGGMNNIFSSQDIANDLGYPQTQHLSYHPHNQFIGDFMQSGIIGVSISLALYVVLFCYAIKKHKNILLCFLIEFLLISMIDMPLYVYVGVFPFLTIIGLFSSDQIPLEKKEIPTVE